MTVGREERGEDVREAAGRSRGGDSDWLRGAWITAVLGVFYRPEGITGGPEAIEFVLHGGDSVLLTCASDRTLRITPGSWPELPDWCVPAGQWQFSSLTGLPGPPYGGAWTVTGTEERRDGSGEVCEVVIRCEDGDFVAAAEDTMAIRFVRS
ncbi:hypothetical protein [Streptomyces fulvorobeus]|uniref:Uncharacterized protein n=1 Tax=Streptomyces fulvorobeus TaxID=284028 RepID=A0A7J0C992_9ACTN|nr:hypothetical protein [Streptomyces fulvorobeus]NYE42685.1 hypothetical protein [Streptomyces fulvorobeus]GFM99095.1 hypothetical protein Sfulv_39060 [Streptomyces fulvorobeus]